MLLQSLRHLIRRPGYTIAAVLTLALGIGASTGMFSILYESLLRPLPYAESDRLIRVRDLYEPSNGSGGMSVPNYLDLAAETRTVAELAAFSSTAFNVAGPESPERLRGLRVTSNFLDALGMAPVAGRGFVEGEDRAGSPAVVVITDRVWRDQYDGSPDVVGRTLQLDARPHTIIGVLPTAFWLPYEPQVVVPFSWTDADRTESRGSRRIEGVGRLAEDASLGAAEAELKAIFARLATDFPGSNQGWSVRAWSFRDWAVGGNRTSLLLLAGAVLLVLLIGSVNVANLMLVRAERRTREMAVRAALGAGRGRVAWQFVTEGLLLAVMGGLAGIVVAWATMRVLVGLYGDQLSRAGEVALTLPALGFAVALALLTGLLVGLIPALRLDVRNLSHALREGGRGSARGPNRTQGALVAAEVAVAVLLVAGAALLLNSFLRLNAVETGIETEDALSFAIQLPTARYDSTPAVHRFFNDAVARVAALPGVEHVGISERTPLQGGYNITTLPSPVDPELEASFVEIRRVTPDYFQATGIPLLRGRGFTAADGRQAASVVVISDELARIIFPDGDAVGRTILPDWPTGPFEVVGVVGSVREFGLVQGKRPSVYWPWGTRGASHQMNFVVRTAGDPMALVPSLRSALRELDPTLPLYGIRTMEEVARETTGSRWLATTLFAAFGVVALALAALGIFGVLAYVVEQRTREIGVRVAMGATSAAVVRMVVTQGLRPVVVGLVVGMGVALFATDLLVDLLFGVEPTDPLTLAAVAAVTLGAGALATLLPALRATRVHPMVALREE